MEEELSRDQELQGKRKSSYVVNMLAALVLVLIIVAGALVYLYVRESRESVRIEEVLQNERDSLQGNLERVVSDYDALKTDNAALQEKLDVEKQRAQDLLDEVKRVRQVSYGKIKEYQRELGTLRAIMRKMVGEIDSLNTLNKALVAENTKVRTEYQESQRNVEKLSEERAELAARVDKGAELRARGVTVIGLTKRDKETGRASRIQKLRTCFTLMENAIAEAGVRRVYIRIFGPDGALLANAEGGTFAANEGQLTYTAVREVDYQNADTDVCIYYGEDGRYERGVYRVEVYSDGVLVGEGETSMR